MKEAMFSKHGFSSDFLAAAKGTLTNTPKEEIVVEPVQEVSHIDAYTAHLSNGGGLLVKESNIVKSSYTKGVDLASDNPRNPVTGREIFNPHIKVHDVFGPGGRFGVSRSIGDGTKYKRISQHDTFGSAVTAAKKHADELGIPLIEPAQIKEEAKEGPGNVSPGGLRPGETYLVNHGLSPGDWKVKFHGWTTKEVPWHSSKRTGDKIETPEPIVKFATLNDAIKNEGDHENYKHDSPHHHPIFSDAEDKENKKYTVQHYHHDGRLTAGHPAHSYDKWDNPNKMILTKVDE